ncbi:hypothetical protein AcV7_001439 [Taiwanofungus camphoratus]|nr:hypothetical protein AcV7_001439 [Antrodia cinnamomea]
MILPNLALNVLLFTSMTTALDLRHQMSNAASPTLPRTSTPSPGFDATVVALTRDARVRTPTTIPSSLTTVAKRQESSISDTGASSSNTGRAATTCVASPTESRESSHSVAATSTPAEGEPSATASSTEQGFTTHITQVTTVTFPRAGPSSTAAPSSAEVAARAIPSEPFEVVSAVDF